MTTFKVTPYLNPGAFGLPAGPVMETVSFDVEAPDALGACEVAFAVCNSYAPDEVFCDARYIDTVRAYRDRKHRSLSVDDYVKVDEDWFQCLSFGFGPCDEPRQPTETHLTPQQDERLRVLCERYHVEFDPQHYYAAFDLPEGWVQGWIGGQPGTLFVGVSPEGDSHS